jgi:malonate-semialdehyde dehydrogenase (acetylating)/methylmalonate-semialdehyde dehydrogenase
MSTSFDIRNFVNGQWSAADAAAASLAVLNPATGETLGETPQSPGAEVDRAVQAAAAALPEWRRTPPGERVQYLFKLKALMERDVTELARTITLENGKILSESLGEMTRAIENVEVACGIPILMQGDVLEDVSRGIDELMIRQPVGVCAIICPFNFPGMIPFWFFPYALACGNTVIVKPSDRTPLTLLAIARLIEETGLPPGIFNVVNGGADTVNALLDHAGISAVSFVGSTAVARHVYARGSAAGKRVQAQGGAKNPVVVLPDAEIDMATQIVVDSAYGSAGQRCLAASLAITVGDATAPFTEAMAAAASNRVVGNGLDDQVEMGPVISHASKERIERLVGVGAGEGARVVVDGRNASIAGLERGSFVRPTLLADVSAGSTVATTEIFGPVFGVMHADTVEDAIRLVNSGDYGNMACLFTTDGRAARRFRYEADVGNIGINIGVAAPMAYFPFSGWRSSFFGVLHGQGKHAVEFFTQTKVVVERWPEYWSRKF